MIGPQPLTLENEQRLEAFADQAAGYGGRFRDFYELAKTEEPDPAWSEAVEQQLRQAIIRNGAKFTGIQTSAPHCTRTVCMLVATGGQGSEVANADWQRLMGLLMNEPWFRENFDDTHSAVQSSPAGVMYISFFIRKG